MSLFEDTNPRTRKELLADDYDAFPGWRQQRLWKEFQRVTGLKVAANLENPVETTQ